MFSTLILLFLAAPDPPPVVADPPEVTVVADPPPVVPAIKTVCNCTITEECVCWQSQCACAGCGLAPARSVPVVPFSGSTKDTAAPDKSGTATNTSGATSSSPTSPESTGTGLTITAPALDVGQSGITNCPT